MTIHNNKNKIQMVLHVIFSTEIKLISRFKNIIKIHILIQEEIHNLINIKYKTKYSIK